MSAAGRWLHRFAVLTAVFAFLMLTVGGLVTSLKAGLAYLDWPTSGGYLLNPPGWMSERDTLVEHGHRLLGYPLSLLGVTLLVWIWLHAKRLRWMIAAVFLLGAAQAVLGGTRVTERSSTLAFVHGCVGQVFLCLVIAIAYLTSRDARRPSPGDARPLLTVSFSALLLILLQIVLGANRRHFGGTVALQLHLMGALMVFLSVGGVAIVAWIRHRRDRALFLAAMVLAGLVSLQVVLGFLALHFLNAYGGGLHSPAEALMPSLHQVAGALTLAAAMLVVLMSARRTRVSAPRVAGVPA